MNAVLPFQITVGHRTPDRDRGAVDARFFVILPVEERNHVVVLLGPLRVHPQQHFRPVVGVGPPVAGVDADHRCRGVVRTVQQCLELQAVERFFQALNFGAHLGCVIPVFLRQFQHGRQIAS